MRRAVGVDMTGLKPDLKASLLKLANRDMDKARVLLGLTPVSPTPPDAREGHKG